MGFSPTLVDGCMEVIRKQPWDRYVHQAHIAPPRSMDSKLRLRNFTEDALTIMAADIVTGRATPMLAVLWAFCEQKDLPVEAKYQVAKHWA